MTISLFRLQEALAEADAAQRDLLLQAEDKQKEFQASLEKQKLELEIQVAEAKVGKWSIKACFG